MARIISDAKTAEAKVSAEAAKSERSQREASRKLHIHLVCIFVAGTISFILYQWKIGNTLELGFGPVAPSIVQEIFDRLFRL